MNERAGGRGGGTHNVKFDRLDRGQVNDLELLSFGKVERGKAFCEVLDTLGGLHASGLIVGGQVLNSLYAGQVRKSAALILRV